MKTKNKVSESIFSNGKYIIPMSEVSFIEETNEYCISIVFKYSKWQNEFGGQYTPIVSMPREDGKKFIAAYCYYRYELEGIGVQK